MKKALTFLMILVAATSMMVFAQGGSETTEQAPMVLKYADNQPYDYPTTEAARYFAQLVEERTDGRIKIEVYHGGQLGDEKAVIEQLQFGAIDFTRVSLSPLAEFEKSLNVLQLPYLYKDIDQMWKVLDGQIGKDFLASVKPQGLIGLAWYDGGARNFYNSKRVVDELSDLKGLKIRVQENNLMMDMVKALGAVATPMPYGEVYSGLQTGVIDGAENNWPSYESTSHYEVAPYYTLDAHTRVPEMVMCSEITWNKFSAEDQKIIAQAAQESAIKERELWKAREVASEKKVREGGATITELKPGEMEKFQNAMSPLYAQYGKGYEDIIKAIQETK